MIPSAMLNIPMFLNLEKQILNPVWAQWFVRIADESVSSAMDLAPSAQSSMTAISTATTATSTQDSSNDDPFMHVQSAAMISTQDGSVDPMANVQPSAFSTYNDTEDALTLFWMGV